MTDDWPEIKAELMAELMPDCQCRSCVETRAALQRVEELEARACAAEAKLAKVLRYHEALLNTMEPSKSPWLQKVVKNAKAALAAAKGESRG